MKSWFFGTVLLAITAVPALAQEQVLQAAIDSYTLDNGLRVVLAPDARVPKVAVTITYGVGGFNEPVGRSGFAHLFEHLMFTGTQAFPNIDATYPALGLNYNAYTEQDGTTYWVDGLASALPVVLSLEADRMANIGGEVDQTELDRERAIVLNEMRQNVLDSPAGAGFEALYDGLYPKPHPYSRAVIGSIPDLGDATLSDVTAFFNVYYTPNDAVLSIVGDFDVAETKTMIEETFGKIARGGEVSSQPLEDFEPARLRLEFEDVVSAPLIYVGFTGPALEEELDAELYVATDLFCNDSYGFIRSALVNTGIAAYAGCWWSAGTLGGRFMVYAGANEGVTAEALEVALNKSIADFLVLPVDPADVVRSRDAYLVNDRTSLEAYQPRSEIIAKMMLRTDDVSGVLLDDPDLLAVTAEGVADAVKKVVVPADASVAIIVPGDRGDYPPVLSEHSGEAEALTLLPRDEVEVTVYEPGEQRIAELPPIETATLSNGIKIIHISMPNAPQHYVTAAAAGGLNNGIKGKEGLISLSLDMAPLGAGNLDRAGLGKALTDLGATINSWTSEQLSGISVYAPPAKFAEAAVLLADVVQRPTFDAEEWKVMIDGTVDSLLQREGNLDGIAARALNAAIFVPGPDDPAIETDIPTVRALTVEEAAEFYHRMFTPKSITMYSVGPLPLAEVTAILEKQFGSWQSNGEGFEPRLHLPVTFPEGQSVYVVPEPGASQTSIYVARPAPGIEQPGFAESIAVMNLLGGDFSSRLNTLIRVQKGYSYGVGASVYDTLPDSGGLVVNTPVEREATGEALADVLAGFADLTATPPTKEEINRTVTAFSTSLASLPETAAGLFNALVLAEGIGRDLGQNLDFLATMTSIDLAEVQKQAVVLSSLDQSVIVLSGDPDVILPQLEAMGITDVTMVERPQ